MLQHFYDKNSRQTLANHANHSVMAKFKIIKGLKGFKKSEITSLREIYHLDADFQKEPFTDDFQNSCSYKLCNTGAFF